MIGYIVEAGNETWVVVETYHQPDALPVDGTEWCCLANISPSGEDLGRRMSYPVRHVRILRRGTPEQVETARATLVERVRVREELRAEEAKKEALAERAT